MYSYNGIEVQGRHPSTCLGWTFLSGLYMIQKEFPISLFILSPQAQNTLSARSGHCHYSASIQSTPTEGIKVSQSPKLSWSYLLHLSTVPWSPTTSPILLLILYDLRDTSPPSLYGCSSHCLPVGWWVLLMVVLITKKGHFRGQKLSECLENIQTTEQGSSLLS